MQGGRRGKTNMIHDDIMLKPEGNVYHAYLIGDNDKGYHCGDFTYDDISSFIESEEQRLGRPLRGLEMKWQALKWLELNRPEEVRVAREKLDEYRESTLRKFLMKTNDPNGGDFLADLRASLERLNKRIHDAAIQSLPTSHEKSSTARRYNAPPAQLKLSNQIKRQSAKTPSSKKEAPNQGGYVDYYDYINSPEWKERARKRMRMDRFQCSVCGTAKNLAVHHITYERLGHEDMDDLITLCKDCHAKVHENDLAKKGANHAE